MLTYIERELLVYARHIVKDALSPYMTVCNALEIARCELGSPFIGEADYGSPYFPRHAFPASDVEEAKYQLQKSMHLVLGKNPWLHYWIARKLRVPLKYIYKDPEKLRATRIAWIDYMLENW